MPAAVGGVGALVTPTTAAVLGMLGVLQWFVAGRTGPMTMIKVCILLV